MWSNRAGAPALIKRGRGLKHFAEAVGPHVKGARVDKARARIETIRPATIYMPPPCARVDKARARIETLICVFFSHSSKVAPALIKRGRGLKPKTTADTPHRPRAPALIKRGRGLKPEQWRRCHRP